MMDMLLLSICNPIDLISTPSILIDEPGISSISTILNNTWIIDDFPAPVRPTTPTLTPGYTSKVSDFNAY